MNKKYLTLGASSLIAVAVFASSATAQTPAAPPPLIQGPTIPGMCMLSVNATISQSAVGQYVSSRMNQIVAQVKAELQPEDTALSNESRAFQAARATLDAATLQSRGAALEARMNAFRQKADLRQKEVQATEQKAINRISQELDPVARQLYQQKHCSILIDKGSVMIASPDMDLTSQAVAGLNARIQQFAFDREHLDTAASSTGR